MFALNLDKDRRILSATDEQFATPEMPLVETLPDGDICDYIYTASGEYEFSEAPWKPAERIQQELAELHQLLDDTDYIFARGNESLFELATEAPTTLIGVIKWVKQVFEIQAQINTKYATAIAQRKAARARIEELENAR